MRKSFESSRAPEPVPKVPVETRIALQPSDRFAARLRRFGPLGILAILVILAGNVLKPLSAILVLLWVQRSRTPWREIGYVRPKSWINLAGNRAALPGMLYTMIVVAGFGEETVFRGWMFERLGKLFGSKVWAKTLIVLLTSILFGLAHYADQGLAGVEQALITGLVFGTIFAVTGRIFMLMVAHAAFDLTAVAIIYWNLETRVAHFVFK